MAPGITVSQAVVTYGDEEPTKTFEKAVELLEERLRIQRNRPMRSTTLGLMGIKDQEKQDCLLLRKRMMIFLISRHKNERLFPLLIMNYVLSHLELKI